MAKIFSVLDSYTNELSRVHLIEHNDNVPIYRERFHGEIIMYSVTDRQSFDTAKQLLVNVNDYPCIVIVGNKIDDKNPDVNVIWKSYYGAYSCCRKDTSMLYLKEQISSKYQL